MNDAGSAQNPNERYLVLGGIAVFESQVDWLSRELDAVAASIRPDDPDSVEFHASVCFSGRITPWQEMTRDERKETIKRVLAVVPKTYEFSNAFACTVRKAAYPGVDPMELAFEDLCRRFDLYLQSTSIGDRRGRGLIILDKSTYEITLQALTRQFRRIGTKWGVIRNIVDAPMFINSRASRIVQLADHIAYATFRRYESGDTSYFDIVASRFFERDGVLHGLAHKQPYDPFCMCPACVTRRMRQAC